MTSAPSREYVATAAPPGARIGLAGRDTARVEKVRATLGDAAKSWEIVRADATDLASLREMAERTTVVVTTVGPYADYGLPLVRACAEAGTDYADLTGEALFVRDSIDAFYDLALAKGARIVHSCGFDSVPSESCGTPAPDRRGHAQKALHAPVSDLSVYLTYLRAVNDGEGELESSTLVCTAKGRLSGGTVASGRGQLRAIAADRALAKVVDDPYALSTDRALEPDLGQQPDGALSPASTIDASLTGWVATFLMAAHNTRIVRRSNALLGWVYGKQFRYREVMRVPGRTAPLTAAGIAAALWTQKTLGPWAHRGIGERIIDRFVPQPGTGPSARARDRGYFSMKTFTTTSTGARYRTTFAADGDPGYKATAVILGEVGLCLVLDRAALSTLRGVLTPAPVMAEPLANRLVNAGVTIDIERN